MKTFFKICILLVIIFFSSIFGAFLWLNRPSENIPSKGKEFEIKRGDTSYSIARRLQGEGYIHSKELFIIISRILKLDKNLKAGWIKLQPNSDTINIINSVYKGKQLTFSFTVPEGATVKRIKEILIENNVSDYESVEAFFSNPDYPSEIGLEGFESAEGFLFPDTYTYYKGVTVKTIMKNMVTQFYKKVEQVYPDYRNLSKDELYEKIIMASIVEKEAKLQEEAPIIAGIFYNRIEIWMRLQSCATIQYILQKPNGKLLLEDLEIDHPYNTYRIYGLPPGPICNPGAVALNAAFNPAKHEYLYFVVKDPKKGSHHFSKEFDEHVNAKFKMKRRIY